MASVFTDQSGDRPCNLSSSVSEPSDVTPFPSEESSCGLPVPALCSGSDSSDIFDMPEDSSPQFQDLNLEFPLPDPDFHFNTSLCMLLDPDPDAVLERQASDKVAPLQYPFSWKIEGMADVLR